MNCVATRNVLDYFVDHRLTDKMVQRVSNHVDHCVSCRREVVLLKKIKIEIFQLETPAMLAQLRSLLHQRLSESTAPTTIRFNWRLSPAYGMALGYLLLMLVASTISFGIPSQAFAGTVERRTGEHHG